MFGEWLCADHDNLVNGDATESVGRKIKLIQENLQKICKYRT